MKGSMTLGRWGGSRVTSAASDLRVSPACLPNPDDSAGGGELGRGVLLELGQSPGGSGTSRLRQVLGLLLSSRLTFRSARVSPEGDK